MKLLVKHTVTVVVVANSNINAITEAAVGGDIRRVVSERRRVAIIEPVVAEVVTVAVSPAALVRANDQDCIATLVKWVVVLALRDCFSCGPDNYSVDLLLAFAGRGGYVFEFGLRTLDGFNAGAFDVRSRARDGQANGEGDVDENGGETHADGDKEKGLR